MTTPEAAALYLAQHRCDMYGRQIAIHNPNTKPIDDLPVIYGFNNGGSPGWLQAVAIAQDGTVLAGHVCSDEGYIPHDLGCLNGTSPGKHETYREHYSDGYRMEFVASNELERHAGLQAALAHASPEKSENDSDHHMEAAISLVKLEHACCPEARAIVEWRAFDNFCGPDRGGWCVGVYSSGDVSYTNIAFCPFCGEKLKED